MLFDVPKNDNAYVLKAIISLLQSNFGLLSMVVDRLSVSKILFLDGKAWIASTISLIRDWTISIVIFCKVFLDTLIYVFL